MDMIRKLDKKIAERVFGFEVVETDDCNGIDNFWISPAFEEHMLEPYSTDIHSAWKVVEKLREMDFPMCVMHVRHPAIEHWEYLAKVESPDGFFEFETADSAPLAICLAALYFLEGKSCGKRVKRRTNFLG